MKMPDPNGPMIKDKETGLLTDRPAEMIDNPEKQAVIERIWQLRSQGLGLRRICGLASFDCCFYSQES
jgi:hypothetical protein